MSKLSDFSVGSYVWNDLNNNGIQDSGEPAIAGAVVDLYSSTSSAGSYTLQGQRITDANGKCKFEDLLAGAYYYLGFHAPVGYTAFTATNAGVDDTKDSDIGYGGRTSEFTVGGSQTNSAYDAGFCGTAPTFGFALQESESVSRAVATDDQGNVYVTGGFGGRIDFDPGPGVYYVGSSGSTSGHAFVAKYSAAGALAWAYATYTDGQGNGIAVASDGSVYVTGSVPSATGSNSDICVFKLDSAGNLVWSRTMGGSGSDVGNSIALTSDGSVYTTGSFAGTVDFDPGAGTANLISAGAADIFISKLDSAGNFCLGSQYGRNDW